MGKLPLGAKGKGTEFKMCKVNGHVIMRVNSAVGLLAGGGNKRRRLKYET